MFSKFKTSNRSSMPEQGGTGIKRMPEQGGTGIALMPEQGGTGATRFPEQGGTGLSRGLFALVLMLAIPLSPALATDKDRTWSIRGEIEGNAQVSIDPDQLIRMSFMLDDAAGTTQLYVASGIAKNNVARLSVFRADLSDDASLVAQGSMDVFLSVCGADAEWQPKSENEGTGGKAVLALPDSLVFTLSNATTDCVDKAENEGTG